MTTDYKQLIDAPALEHKRGEPLPVRNGLAMSPYKTEIDGREYRVFYRLIVRLPSGEKEITLD
jgi:hypothetical protein